MPPSELDGPGTPPPFSDFSGLPEAFREAFENGLAEGLGTAGVASDGPGNAVPDPDPPSEPDALIGGLPASTTTSTADPDALAGMPATLDPADADGRALANLAHIIAHRMRGPLTSIQMYTDLLAEDLGSNEHRDMAFRIFESAFALESMLADLQRFSLTLSPVARRVAPEELVMSLLDGMGGEGELVDIDLVAGGAPVEADPLLVRQALLILLQNALDAAYPVSQRAEAEAGAVRIGLAYEDEAVCFTVWNAGTLDDAGRVFEPFYTTKSGNLGIGLCIAERIAKAHGGQLLLSTRAETGVEFTLRLPIGGELPALPTRV